MENYEEMLEKINRLCSMEEKHAKQVLLEIVSLVKLPLSLENLKLFLKEEKYESIEKRLMQWVAQEFPPVEGWTKEKIYRSYQETINGTIFYLAIDEQGSINLRKYNFEEGEVYEILTTEEIPFTDFIIAIRKAMIKYRDNNKFDENVLEQREIEKILKESISAISSRMERKIAIKLNTLQEMSENEIKLTMLQALSITETPLRMCDLENMLSSKTSKKIRKQLEKQNEEEFLEREGWNSDRIENLLENSIEDDEFYIDYDGNKKYSLREVSSIDKEKIANINIEDILIENLGQVVSSLMKKYRENVLFCDNAILDDKDIPNVLDATIQATTQENVFTPNMHEKYSKDEMGEKDKWTQKPFNMINGLFKRK